MQPTRSCSASSALGSPFVQRPVRDVLKIAQRFIAGLRESAFGVPQGRQSEKFLSNDLTIAGVDAAKGLFAKAKADGVEVQKSMDALIAELNSVAATITPAKAAAKQGTTVRSQIPNNTGKRNPACRPAG